MWYTYPSIGAAIGGTMDRHIGSTIGTSIGTSIYGHVAQQAHHVTPQHRMPQRGTFAVLAGSTEKPGLCGFLKAESDKVCVICGEQTYPKVLDIRTS